MKNKLILAAFLMTNMTYAGFYTDISGGVIHRELDGDSGNYQSSQSFGTELSIGHQWENWDLALEGVYSVGRQKNFSQTVNQANVNDDFTWQAINVGPTLKYHIESESGKWSWAPFIGIHFNKTGLDSSAAFRDSLTNEVEGYDPEMWGYGGKLGVQFKQKVETSWLDAISYKVFASYTQYEKTELDYPSNNRIVKYDDNTPDKLKDYSLGLLVGFSFGEKTFSSIKNLF